MLRALGLKYEANDIIDLLEGASLKRLVNYLTKQRNLHPKCSAGYIVMWYKDYLSMSESLKVGLSHKSVRFPRDIKAAHDIITARFNSVKHEIEDANLSSALHALYEGMSEYEKGDYRIVFPTTRSEFITEGQTLNHCVGNDRYFQNHMAKTQMVFFIRKKAAPERPYFTMEIDMRSLKILQLYGFGDISPPPEVRAFATGFVDHLKPARRAVS